MGDDCSFSVIATLPSYNSEAFISIFNSANINQPHLLKISNCKHFERVDNDTSTVYLYGECDHSIYMCMLPTQESYFFKAQVANYSVENGIPVRGDIDMAEYPSMKFATHIIEVCKQLNVASLNIIGNNNNLDFIEIYIIINGNISDATICEPYGIYRFN